jgi:hypothetical protein
LCTLAPEQIILLKYEELISDPEATLRRLCSFLDEEFEPRMLEYHRSAEARRSGSLSVSWRNSGRPVLTGNSGKYLHSLSDREIRQIETIAGSEMRALGYAPLFPPAPPGMLTRERVSYRVTESLLKIRAEANHLLRDKNSLARVKKNLYLRSIALLRLVTPPHD